MKAFHAYDIRGVYNKDFNKDDVYKVGYHLVKFLNVEKVLVGYDARVSSPEIFEYLSKGITDAGADVHNVGLSTTPMIYYGTAKKDFKASVQITASHNPREYNGMKISRENALPVGLENGLDKIKEKIDQNVPIQVAQNKGKIIGCDIKEEYVQFLKQYKKDYSDLRIAVDCSNGMIGLIIKDLLENTPYYLYEELDGTFSNHEANPLDPKNIIDLQKVVQQQKCDVGIIFDGDGDRVMFVDENSRFISPDLMIALLGHYFFEERGEKGIVLQDIRTSNSVKEYLEPMGASVHTWKVGRAFAARKLREINGIYGGELAGHYYFRDFFFSDSGMLACLLILNIISKLKKQEISLSQAISKIETYANSGEINFKLEQKKEAMDAVRSYFIERETAITSLDFDGYRVEFSDWWFNIRPSNTEPYLRLLAEAKTKTILDEKIETIKQIMKNFT